MPSSLLCGRAVAPDTAVDVSLFDPVVHRLRHGLKHRTQLLGGYDLIVQLDHLLLELP